MQNKFIYLSLAVLTCFGIYFFGFQRKNAKSWDKALHIFVGLDQVFNPGVLMPRDLWNAARFIHREMVSMEPRQRLNWGEYERRSSIDCAVWAHLSQGIHAADYKDKRPFRWRDEHLVDLAGKIARMSDPSK